MGRTTINLALADVEKERPSFDLPIAIGMLAGNDQLMSDQPDNSVVVGKLALTGSARMLRARLSIAQLPRTMEVSPQLTIFSVVSVIVRPYSLSDKIYDLERTSLTLWTPSV
jgi:predicted ATPase with chaperone activity